MSRRANYVPHGVIPAVLLPFDDDLAIDETSFRAHLRDVATTDGISAITINAHSTVASRTGTFCGSRNVFGYTTLQNQERSYDGMLKLKYDVNE